MVSCGMSEDDIARAINCATTTLRKYFEHELVHGRAKRRREIIGLLYKSARAGNVSAQRKLHEMTGIAGAADEFLDQAKAEKALPTEQAPKLGKKEQAAADAAVPDTSTEIGRLMERRNSGALH